MGVMADTATHAIAAPAQPGDTLTIDFKGMVNGVAFPGGTGKDYDLTLGSKTFIPGFEDQLVGVKVGEEKAVKVRFPDDYHAKELAGQDAVFMVTVKANKGHDWRADLNGSFGAMQKNMAQLQRLRVAETEVMAMQNSMQQLEEEQRKAAKATEKARNMNTLGHIIGLSVGVGAVVGGAQKMRFWPKLGLAALAGGIGDVIGGLVTHGPVARAEAKEQQLMRDSIGYQQAVSRELDQMQQRFSERVGQQAATPNTPKR